MTWTEKSIPMRDQVLQGPQTFAGAWFVPLCVTPTGVRFDGENYVFRDAAIWLSENMIARLAGLPLIAGMIDGTLDSTEFAKRVVGIVVQGFVRDNALMCIARICNYFALRIIQSGSFETRVAATFNDEAGEVDLGEGKLIVEPPPRYLSHLSLVPEGSEPFEYGLTLTNQEAAYAY